MLPAVVAYVRMLLFEATSFYEYVNTRKVTLRLLHHDAQNLLVAILCMVGEQSTNHFPFGKLHSQF
jgi:hypothetical protein